jgi:hypothetical protein
MAKIELDELMIQAEKILLEFRQQFNMILNKKLNESNNEKEKNFELLRPTLGHPTKKNYLQTIDNREKERQDDIQKIIDQLRSNTIVDSYI